MEEDIKILEDLIELYKCCGVDGNPSVVVEFAVTLRDIKAIENLIQRNKYLEENRIWSEATLEGLKKDYIPKSRVKETIKNIEEVLDFTKTGQDNKSKIQCEILENVINKLKQELLD